MELVKIGDKIRERGPGTWLARRLPGKEMDNVDYGLTAGEKKQLLTLLDKINSNHCKNYHGSCFGWSCANKSDNEVCPIEYEVYLETELQERGGFFYCPLFIIRDILEEENEN